MEREEQDQELEQLLNVSNSDGEYEKDESEEYQDTEELKSKLKSFKAKTQREYI